MSTFCDSPLVRLWAGARPASLGRPPSETSCSSTKVIDLRAKIHPKCAENRLFDARFALSRPLLPSQPAPLLTRAVCATSTHCRPPRPARKAPSSHRAAGIGLVSSTRSCGCSGSLRSREDAAGDALKGELSPVWHNWDYNSAQSLIGAVDFGLQFRK